jgi:hypothetical protein
MVGEKFWYRNCFKHRLGLGLRLKIKVRFRVRVRVGERLWYGNCP